MSRFLWTQKDDRGPRPRSGHAMSADSVRARVVLFGGESAQSTMCDDTWEWDGTYWTQVSDIGPTARRDHAMVYDAEGRQTVLFGGFDGSMLGDTWRWDGADWTQLADGGPSPRRGHALAYDSFRHITVLFGGESGSGSLGDTWEFDGRDWAQHEDIGPAPRRFHNMAFDPASKSVILVGGDTGAGEGPAGTWAWDGVTWTQVAVFGPDNFQRGALATTADAVVLFGGVDAITPQASRSSRDTWDFRGKRWTRRQDIGPAARYGHAMTFDTISTRIVLFGGASASTGNTADPTSEILLSDTWESTSQTVESESSDPTQLAVQSILVQPTVIPLIGDIPMSVDVVLNRPAPLGSATVLLGCYLGTSSNPHTPGELVGEPITILAGSNSKHWILTSGQITSPLSPPPLHDEKVTLWAAVGAPGDPIVPTAAIATTLTVSG